MTTPRDPMLQALEGIRPSDTWRKELAGLPTYFAAAMLAWHYAESTVIGSFAVMTCFIMVYHYIYEFIFPRFESGRKWRPLVIFFLAQLVVWAGLFIVWFSVLR